MRPLSTAGEDRVCPRVRLGILDPKMKNSPARHDRFCRLHMRCAARGLVLTARQYLPAFWTPFIEVRALPHRAAGGLGRLGPQ
jgi:hypothetical protein